jgi:CRP/FNR family cyclic AMP-dependent transcriptional regulator
MASRKSKGGTDTCQAAIEGIGIFSGLTRTQHRSLARLMTCVPVKAGRTLTTEGQSGREFMIIVEGRASVRRDGHLMATLGPGEFFGEMSLIAGAPRSATVTAETDMLIETLNRREFSSMLDENPSLARKVLVGAVKRLQELDAGPAD